MPVAIVSVVQIVSPIGDHQFLLAPEVVIRITHLQKVEFIIFLYLFLISTADFMDDEVWNTGNQWGGLSGSRKPAPPFGGLENRLSPPPAARMHNAMYGNGNESVGGGSEWFGETQTFSVHMRGLPFRATENDIANVSFSWVLFDANRLTECVRSYFRLN